MNQPVVYFAVTSHGFGHAVRSAIIAAKLQQLRPDIGIIFATVAPEWLLKSYIKGDFIYHPSVFDVGVIQQDSLTMDKETTLAKMQDIIDREDEIIAREVEFIREHNVSLILADIPALAVPIARAANIPCWMVSNFAWDFIYQHWGEKFAGVVSWLQNYYHCCDRTFRLPLHEPMSVFPNITDVGLTGITSRHNREDLSRKFNLIKPQAKTALLTFGGLGIEAIPYDNLQRFPDWQFIAFDRTAPDLPNLLKVTDDSYRPIDFMPLCSRVFSKPGYSTFSEALYLDLPIISLTREDFAEAEVLLDAIQNYSQHRIVSLSEFFAGNWDFLTQNLLPPRLDNTLSKDGAETIVGEIANYCS
ncbi:MAG: glycosyl transferase [Pleurocapsa sp.]